MRFKDLNWFDVENYLEGDDRIMVVLGSCEQHGYLSLQTDLLIPEAIGDAASQASGVLVSPAMPFGASPYFLDYPGTVSMRISTLMDVVEDIVRSLYGHGFRRILVLNGHGGNDPVRGRLYELANQFLDLRLSWYAWWHSHSVEAISQKYELKGYHGSWFEAFPFTRVIDLPEGEKAPPFVPGLLGATAARKVYGDGVFGGQYQVSLEIMQEIFDACVADVLQMLKFEH